MTILGQEIKIGSRLYFEGERQGYIVQAFSDNFIICTKPFNARKTYLYTIIDLKRDIRGPDDLIFGSMYPYDNPEDANRNLQLLENGKKQRENMKLEKPFKMHETMEVSYRRNAPLKITKVKV